MADVRQCVPPATSAVPPGSTRYVAFDPIPSFAQAGTLRLEVAQALPPGASCLEVLVAPGAAVPPELGVGWAPLRALGFEGGLGETTVLLRGDGKVAIAVGTGAPGELDAARLRDAAAAFARASVPHGHLATTLATTARVSPEVAAQAVVEGVLLARYRYDVLKRRARGSPLVGLTLVVPAEQAEAVRRGAERGRACANATQLARDLANTPPAHLGAARMAEVAEAVATACDLDVEVFDGEALAELGCGGLLGVNQGSSEPPRMIKLSYRPRDASGRPFAHPAHLALVGKGVTYDAGGLGPRPGDGLHAAMKLDMAGAAAVLAAMSALSTLGCRAAVTGYLMCTDNLPSATALKRGDVLTQRNGRTVEVSSTDAEGQLLLADAMALAAEEEPDALLDIATLTGACLRTFGRGTAALLGNHAGLMEQVQAAARRTDERVWPLPLDHRLRRHLDSGVADLRNAGGEHAGTILAALFLNEFTGGLPWAHLDIYGPMEVDADEAWRSRGATGFGARLLLDLALNFSPPVRH